MTIVAAPRPPDVSGRTSNFVGTLDLLRLNLRRDRIIAPLWILLLSVPLATVYVASVSAVYPTEAARAGMAASIMASPAQRAMYGNIYNSTLGSAALWKAGMFHLLIGVAVILTVIRHTRADEEAGRTELIDSTVVGRYAGLAAALLLGVGASGLTGAIGFGGLLTTDVPAAGALAFTLALTASGTVFSTVAAVAAQLTPSARTARSLAFSVLALTFTLRAIGDVSSSTGSSRLTWLSPLGWSLQVRPFAGDRWWVLLLHIALAAALTYLAFALLGRRDVGAGLLPERPGAAVAAPRLAGPNALAWRLDRGSLVLWTVALCLYGLVIGSVAHGVGDEVGGSAAARDIITRLGGTTAMEQAFIAIAFTMLAMAASAMAVSTTLRLHQEEATGRAEPTLAGAVDRSRWLGSHLAMALGGSGIALLAAGAVAGLTYGVVSGDVGGKAGTVLGTAAVQLPAVWLPAAVTIALFGVAPRFTPIAWGVLVGFVALYLLGSISGFPQWVLNLEPFAHIPQVGGTTFSPTPLLGLLAVDVVLITLGVITFRRRDLR